MAQRHRVIYSDRMLREYIAELRRERSTSRPLSVTPSRHNTSTGSHGSLSATRTRSHSGPVRSVDVRGSPVPNHPRRRDNIERAVTPPLCSSFHCGGMAADELKGKRNSGVLLSRSTTPRLMPVKEASQTQAPLTLPMSIAEECRTSHRNPAVGFQMSSDRLGSGQFSATPIAFSLLRKKPSKQAVWLKDAASAGALERRKCKVKAAWKQICVEHGVALVQRGPLSLNEGLLVQWGYSAFEQNQILQSTTNWDTLLHGIFGRKERVASKGHQTSYLAPLASDFLRKLGKHGEECLVNQLLLGVAEHTRISKAQRSTEGTFPDSSERVPLGTVVSSLQSVVQQSCLHEGVKLSAASFATWCADDWECMARVLFQEHQSRFACYLDV